MINRLRIWSTALLVAALVAVTGTPSAEARLLDLYAGLRAGGGIGRGVNDLAPSSADFFETTRGPALGVELGGRILFIDASLSFTQFIDGNGQAGTFTQALVGSSGSIGLGPQREVQDYLRLGFGVGFGFGTKAPVDPPLDNAQISDKGVVGQAVIGWDHYLTRFISLGLELNGGYHYFFAGGEAAANDLENQSQGVHLLGFVTLRGHLFPIRAAN